MAFLRALQEAAPDVKAFTAASAGLTDLAAAAADIALGHSVVLQLKPDLDRRTAKCSASLSREGRPR